MARPSLWWALLAIVLVATVYEYDATIGGWLLLVIVLGMLYTAKANGTISFTGG